MRQSWDKCRGLFRDLDAIPRFPPTELSVLRWSSFCLPGRAFRIYLAHVEKARQLNDCDVTPWYTDRVSGAAIGPPKARDCSFAARPAAPRDQLRQVDRTFSLQDECAFLAVIGWICLLRIKSEAIPMIRRIPAGNMSEYGQASSHSVLGRVGSCLAIKLRRRKHMAFGSILKRSCCCVGRNPDGEDLHAPQL